MMDQEDEQQPGPNQLKWRSKKVSRRSGKPYERRPSHQPQSIVNRITSTVSSIIPSWIKGAASNFLVPIDPDQDQADNVSDSEPEDGEEEEVVIEREIIAEENNDEEDEEEENEGSDPPALSYPRIGSDGRPLGMDFTVNHRPVDRSISDPQSPFDPASRNCYPMTSTVRKTKITSSTASRLGKKLAQSKMKVQQHQHQQQQADDDSDEVPDEAAAAGPSNPVAGRGTNTPNDCVDDDRSSTSENTASSTSGCSSLVPSHQDHTQAQHPQLQQTRIHFPKDSLERLRIELMKKKQNTSARTSTNSFDGPSSRPSSSTSNTHMNQQQGPSGGTSSMWLHSSVSRMQAAPAVGFPASLSRPGSGLGQVSLTSRSPFYDGRTTYGGSSGRRAARLVNSNPYSRGVRIPPVLHVRVSDRSGSSSQENLSEAARKILQTMSSPLQDAKKIPLNESQGLSNRSVYQSYNRPSACPNSSGISTSILNRSNQPLAAASVKDQSHRMTWPIDLKDFVDKNKKTTEAQDISSRPQESGNVSSFAASRPPVQSDAGSGGGKMKSSLSSARISSRDIRDTEETLETLSQASGVTHVPLPAPKSLPTFNFSSGPSAVNTDAAASSNKSSSVAKTVQSVRPAFVDEFPFSSPVPSSLLSMPNRTPAKDGRESNVPVPAVVTEQQKRLPSGSKNAVKNTTSYLPPSKPTEKVSLNASLHQTAADGSATPSSSPSSAFSLKNNVDKSPKPVSTSLFDVATKQSESSLPEKKPDSWSCKKCMLSNSHDASRCMACQEPRFGTSVSNIKKPVDAPSPVVASREEAASTKPPPVTAPIVSQFKLSAPAPGSWNCPICMITNSPDKNVCAACEAIKPNPGVAAPPPAATLLFAPGFGSVKPSLPSSSPFSFSSIASTEQKGFTFGSSSVMEKNSLSSSSSFKQTEPVVSATPTAPKAAPAVVSPMAFEFGSTKAPSFTSSSAFSLTNNVDSSPKPTSTSMFGSNLTASPFSEKKSESSWSFKDSTQATPITKGFTFSAQTPQFGAPATTKADAPQPVSTVKETTTATTGTTPAPVQQFKFAAPAPGSWTCSVCMITNSADKNKCAACEAPNPKAAPVPAPSKPAEPMFPAFSFGAPSSKAESSVPVFGAKPAEQKAPMFTFGQPAAKPAEPLGLNAGSKSEVTTTTMAPSIFGGSLAPSTPSASPFASSSLRPAAVPTTPASSFMMPAAPAAPAPQPSLGATLTAPATPVFSFGSTSTPAKPVVFGAASPFAPSPAPSFNFGSGTPTVFGAAPSSLTPSLGLTPGTSAAAASLFNVNTESTGERKIRKAKRRLK